MSPEEKQAPLASSGMPPETFDGLKTVNRYHFVSFRLYLSCLIQYQPCPYPMQEGECPPFLPQIR